MISRKCDSCGDMFLVYPSNKVRRFCNMACRTAWYEAERLRRHRRGRPSTGEKKCTRCGEIQPVDFFSTDRVRKDQLAPQCKACMRDHAILFRKNNPEKESRRSFLKGLERRNGITLEQYQELLRRQNGGCGVCGARYGRGDSVRLYVDHDHLTGAVRGLLCQRCNSAIGLFGESEALIHSALGYLQMPPAIPSREKRNA